MCNPLMQRAGAGLPPTLLHFWENCQTTGCSNSASAPVLPFYSLFLLLSTCLPLEYLGFSGRRLRLVSPRKFNYHCATLSSKQRRLLPRFFCFARFLVSLINAQQSERALEKSREAFFLIWLPSLGICLLLLIDEACPQLAPVDKLLRISNYS